MTTSAGKATTLFELVEAFESEKGSKIEDLIAKRKSVGSRDIENYRNFLLFKLIDQSYKRYNSHISYFICEKDTFSLPKHAKKRMNILFLPSFNLFKNY
jgi:hypothetical protein